MKYKLQLLSINFLLIILLSGCKTLEQKKAGEEKVNSNIQFKLTPFKQSNFKQVEATFYTAQSKSLVFRVLSDIKKTPEWLVRVNSLEVLNVYNNHQYLLRTIINSPWPFKNRELITCVDTFFKKTHTTINIYSCSDRIPLNELYVRISEIESSWVISNISDSKVEVNYKTWIDPSGNVPAFIFNSELINSTKTDLKKLQKIIDNSVLSEYAY